MKLPVVGSTAATTKFVLHKLEGPGGKHLWIDSNQKIGGWDPKPNAFSILAVDDCPFRTPTCESVCYVQGIESFQKEVYEAYKHNSENIREIIAPFDSRSFDWARHLADWVSQNCEATGFRWHVSGDIFSQKYANWIGLVVRDSYSVRHWIYTRSFPYAGTLAYRENLELNLSADKDNYWLAKRYAEQYGARVCYMTLDGTVPDDLPPGSVIFPDYSLRGSTAGGREWFKQLPPGQKKMVCPVDRLGKSEKVRCGPCWKCLRPSASTP